MSKKKSCGLYGIFGPGLKNILGNDTTLRDVQPLEKDPLTVVEAYNAKKPDGKGLGEITEQVSQTDTAISTNTMNLTEAQNTALRLMGEGLSPTEFAGRIIQTANNLDVLYSIFSMEMRDTKATLGSYTRGYREKVLQAIQQYQIPEGAEKVMTEEKIKQIDYIISREIRSIKASLKLNSEAAQINGYVNLFKSAVTTHHENDAGRLLEDIIQRMLIAKKHYTEHVNHTKENAGGDAMRISAILREVDDFLAFCAMTLDSEDSDWLKTKSEAIKLIGDMKNDLDDLFHQFVNYHNAK